MNLGVGETVVTYLDFAVTSELERGDVVENQLSVGHQFKLPALLIVRKRNVVSLVQSDLQTFKFSNTVFLRGLKRGYLCQYAKVFARNQTA